MPTYTRYWLMSMCLLIACNPNQEQNPPNPTPPQGDPALDTNRRNGRPAPWLTTEQQSSTTTPPAQTFSSPPSHDKTPLPKSKAPPPEEYTDYLSTAQIEALKKKLEENRPRKGRSFTTSWRKVSPKWLDPTYKNPWTREENEHLRTIDTLVEALDSNAAGQDKGTVSIQLLMDAVAYLYGKLSEIDEISEVSREDYATPTLVGNNPIGRGISKGFALFYKTKVSEQDFQDIVKYLGKIQEFLEYGRCNADGKCTL